MQSRGRVMPATIGSGGLNCPALLRPARGGDLGIDLPHRELVGALALGLGPDFLQPVRRHRVDIVFDLTRTVSLFLGVACDKDTQ